MPSTSDSSIDIASTPLRPPWWLSPVWLFAAVMGITAVAAAWQTDHVYRLYDARKYFEFKHLLMALAAIALFAFGSRLGRSTGTLPALAPDDIDRKVAWWFKISAALTIVGYVVWLAMGLRNGFSLAGFREFLTVSDPTAVEFEAREVFQTIPGVTTCTQFGPAAVLLGLWLELRGRRGVRLTLATILLLGTIRALLYSERFALIELVVPSAVLILRMRFLGEKARSTAHRNLAIAPVAGLAGMIVLFGFFESFRSWRYYQDDFDSIAEFTVWRVAGYYTTAHNNGAMALERMGQYPLPYLTLRPLWGFPLLDQTPLDYEKLTGIDPSATYKALLERYNTPELNSEGGLFAPALDYGIPGFVLFWLGAGFVAGRLYRSFLIGAFAGVMIYPLMFLGILESPRGIYLCYTRAFPAIVLLLVVAYAVRQPAAARSTAGTTSLEPEPA